MGHWYFYEPLGNYLWTDIDDPEEADDANERMDSLIDWYIQEGLVDDYTSDDR